MPNNWKTYKLNEIAEILNSKRVPLNSRQRNERKGNIPYYGASGIVDYIDDYIFEGEHVLISEDGENLRSRNTPIAFKANGKFWVNNHAHILKGNEPFLNDWIVYHFANLDLNPYVSGAVQPKLNKQALLSIPIELPEFKEATAIANILSAIDDKIENNLAINKTLEDMAMALYKHWFVDFGPFQDSEFIDSELGPIPKGWEVKRLGDLIEVINGYAFKSAWFQDFGEKVVKIKNISNNVVDINNCNCISAEKALEINDKFKIVPGEFLVAMTGAEVGKVGVVPDYQQPLWLNQRVGKLKDKMFLNSSILVGKILQSKEYYEVIQGLAYGSAQPNISASGIENIEICLPKILEDIQVLIDEFVSSQNQIIHNLTENQSLTKLRDTLLPKLINGEVRLKEFKEQIETVL
ncbi:MAG: restriction endonuclease subunit S [Dokdonia sp.]|jgi:type I restriction enzyme S subunit